MSNANRVKETTTATNTATIALSGAAAGFRTFAVGLPAGAKRTGLKVRVGPDSGGVWLIGAYDLTADGTLTRRVILDSSANGADVTLAGGTKEVELTFTAAQGDRVDTGTSVRVVYASSVVASDSILEMNPTVGSSQTAAVQSLFDLNNDGSSLRIVWDVRCSLDSASSTYCILVNSNTEVVALPGCGAVMRPNQPTSMFRNRNPNAVKDGREVDTANGDKNIIFRGGIWHGNQDNQSVRETSATGGIFLFDFLGVDNLQMVDGIEWRRAVSFAFRGTNVSNVLLQNFFVNFGLDNTKLNSDGIHFNGPAQHLRLLDGRIYGCADDSLSFTANDIFNAPGNYGPYGGVYGPITDVTIDNIDLQGIAAGIRLLASTSRMDRFSIRNVKGGTGGNWLVIDNFTENPNLSMPVGVGNIGTVSIDGVHMKNKVNGNWPKKGAFVNCKVERFVIRNIERDYFENEYFPALHFGSRCILDQLLIENYHSRNYNGGTYQTEQIVFDQGSQLGQVKIKGAIFHSGTAVNGYPTSIETTAKIDQFVLDDCQGMRFTDFVRKDSGATVTNYHVGTNCYMDSAGAAVSTWTLQSGAPWTEDTNTPNRLSYARSPNLIGSAKKKTLDGFGGNVELSSDITINGTMLSNSVIHPALIVRGNAMVPWSGVQSCYGLDISMPVENQIKLFKVVGGTQTTLGSPVALNVGFGVGYRFYLATKTDGNGLTTITVKVKRLSDGQFLQSGNTWGASATNVISVTDSSVPAQSGEWGFYGYNEFNDDGRIIYDNITIAAA